jgi:DNA-binding PadR family transcriptional regulator
MLTITPMNGYLLKKLFDRSINYFWAANLSQIYRELSALEKKGFVSSIIQEQDDRPDKRIYSITDAGNEAFLQWLLQFPENLITPARDEFSLRIFFGSRVGKVELKKQLGRFKAERQKRAAQLLEDKTKIMEATRLLEKTASPEQEQCMRFLSRRAQMTNETLIRWADECIQELDQADEK